MTTDSMDTSDAPESLPVPMSTLDIGFHVLLGMLALNQRLIINGPTASGEFTVAVMSTDRHIGKVTGGRGTLPEALLEAANKLSGING